MININVYKTYTCRGYDYVNFCNLSDNKLSEILTWRNHSDIRQYMYNKNEITFESHIRFVHGLKDRRDVYYWLVLKNGEDIGVVNLTNVNALEDCAELGFYVIPSKMNSGIGAEVLSHLVCFIFENIQISSLWGAIDARNVNAIILDSFIGCKLNEEDVVNLPGVEYIRWTLNKEDFYSRLGLCDNYRNLVIYMRDCKNLLQKLKK